ncbi:hypothetical protein [Carboxydothermus pertinax]|uniref:Uncharacterized protein n=1 Tax=Carboxydothermus pertinax TaxID=870242 RepID=A0A1L8CRV5_9THEO|nr:hypothetical protein [Carboxydothermus pertinax]GAV21656.1 hypothetical protein cpu_01660 [Carboxydothermus pertinax]
MHHLKKKLPKNLRFMEPGWWVVHLTGMAISGVLMYLAWREEKDLEF